MKIQPYFLINYANRQKNNVNINMNKCNLYDNGLINTNFMTYYWPADLIIKYL